MPSCIFALPIFLFFQYEHNVSCKQRITTPRREISIGIFIFAKRLENMQNVFQVAEVCNIGRDFRNRHRTLHMSQFSHAIQSISF
ncbi:hypothetical protein BDF21DRAFT_58818 [Thamnidium elegans]|nr:hypothetical protein BDF21DRAFT_58818 [Thamnidium elegans]